jgi:hypothetical protein
MSRFLNCRKSTYNKKNKSLVKDKKGINKRKRIQLNRFVVESIIDKKKDLKCNDYLYLIKWEGYNDSESTWEPEKNMMIDIPSLILDFNKCWYSRLERDAPLALLTLSKETNILVEFADFCKCL